MTDEQANNNRSLIEKGNPSLVVPKERKDAHLSKTVVLSGSLQGYILNELDPVDAEVSLIHSVCGQSLGIFNGRIMTDEALNDAVQIHNLQGCHAQLSAGNKTEE